MRKAAIASVCAGVFVIALLVGCATTEKGPTDAELIADGIVECVECANAEDIEGLLEHYSESFSHHEFGNKDGLKAFLDSAKDMGYLDGLEIDMEDSETLIEGDTATVGPVCLSGTFGSATLEFTAARETDGWKITGMDIGF